MLVPSRSRDSRKSLLRDTHEVVLRGRRTNSVNRNSQRAIGSVLEAHWEGKAAGQFSV